MLHAPSYTVVYNIVSPGSSWIGTGWEFFDDREAAQKCYDRVQEAGHYPTLRPYFDNADRSHLGAVHRYMLDREDRLRTGIECSDT